MTTLPDPQAAYHCDSLRLTAPFAFGLRVHSLFQRACNLQTTRGDLWVIQTQGMPLAPAGILINRHDLQPLFRVGERLYLDDAGNLRGEKIKMLLNNSVMRSTRLSAHSDGPACAQLARHIAAFFARQPAKGIRLALTADNTLMAAHAALIHWLRSREGNLHAILTTFIGRGEGLTPAGDDFLLGVLLVLAWAEKPEALPFRDALPGLLTRTTDISRAMLAQACQGHYGEQLLGLTQGNAQTWPGLVAKVADYGHSSGHDMLAGMLTAAQISGERGEKTPLHVGSF
ncbi:DUF2877 domain-containing protein [Yokenella regensburgei]|uniref:DUF2877 domain-containing protein n=1 Tax=Yokenella regensburgei TaxID=158877 RepID=UPI003F165186